ncbi:MAG: AbrB/MazE/SpoVT family DNA-binding domain-containing protein [Candidatus Saliniplasma sp.]
MTKVIKVTSKGQITLPSDIRKEMDIDKDNYIAVDSIGDYIILKKITLKLEEISKAFKKEADSKNITKKDIEKAIEESREEVWAE